MIRAAAKNFAFAAPVVSPASYDAILDELRDRRRRRLSLATRESLAAEAFAYTARYDTAITRWFAEQRDDFPPLFVRAFEKVTDLSYGENPHQRAAYYAQVGSPTHLLSNVRQLGGKPLSFNNLLDLNAARLLVREFGGPGVRDRQAQQPVRRGDRRRRARRLPAARSRATRMSAFGGVDLPQPAGRRRARRGARAAVRRGAVRARLRRGGARDAREQTEPADPAGRRAAGAAPRRARPQAGRRRAARAGPRPRHAGARRDDGRDASASRPTPSGASCCSPGASASTCARTRSCSRETARRSASAPGR